MASATTLSSIAQGILDKGEDIVFMETKAFNSMMNTIENLTDANTTQNTQYVEEDKELEEEILHHLQSNVDNEHDEEVVDYNKDTHIHSEVQMLPNETNLDKNENNPLIVKNENAILEERKQLELVLNQGLSFITGMIKLGTGKEMTMNDATIHINKESGEVTFKFKLPN